MTEVASHRNLQGLADVGMAVGELQPSFPLRDAGTINPLASVRFKMIQRVSLVFWGYCFTVWLYVIAMQLRYPNSVYWPLAVWLPIRLDYLGEGAFILSLISAIIAATSSTLKMRAPQ